MAPPCAPDRYACNAALDACAKAGRPREALVLFEAMQAGGRGDDDDDDDDDDYSALPPPDVVSYNIAIALRVRWGTWTGPAASSMTCTRTETTAAPPPPPPPPPPRPTIAPPCQPWPPATPFRRVQNDSRGIVEQWRREQQDSLPLLRYLPRRFVFVFVFVFVIIVVIIVVILVDRGYGILESMPTRYGIRPDASTLLAALNVCAANGDWRRAETLLADCPPSGGGGSSSGGRRP